MPILFLDHDGTWTWSLESGKAFEPGHRVYDRGEGCYSKGDARKEAEAALERLLSRGVDTLGNKL